MIVWGLISALTSLARNYTDLLVIRFFLGFIEAAYFPGCLFYLSSWYTKEEISFRTSLMYSGSLLSGAFGGLIAAGILSGLNGVRGIAAWQWLFIIEGAMTIFVAFCAIFILPNFPATTSWLTEDERAYATWRLAVDGGKADDHVKQSFKDGFIMAITDAKTYVLMLLLYGFVSCGTVTTFFPIVVKTLGFGNTQTLLLTAPPYILGVITTFANALHSDYTKERFYHVCLPPILAVFAFGLAAGTTSTVPRYIAMMLMIPGIYTGYVIGLGWISTSIPRPPAKRAAALALVNAFSNLCSVYMSFAYQSFQAPRYTAAMITNVCTALLSIFMAVVLRYMLIKDNKKLEQEEVEHDREEKGINKGFRYIY
jgi:MFS family permease